MVPFWLILNVCEARICSCVGWNKPWGVPHMSSCPNSYEWDWPVYLTKQFILSYRANKIWGKERFNFVWAVAICHLNVNVRPYEVIRAHFMRKDKPDNAARQANPLHLWTLHLMRCSNRLQEMSTSLGIRLSLCATGNVRWGGCIQIPRDSLRDESGPSPPICCL